MITAADYRFNDGTPVTRQKMDEGDIIIGQGCLAWRTRCHFVWSGNWQRRDRRRWCGCDKVSQRGGNCRRAACAGRRSSGASISNKLTAKMLGQALAACATDPGRIDVWYGREAARVKLLRSTCSDTSHVIAVAPMSPNPQNDRNRLALARSRRSSVGSYSQICREVAVTPEDVIFRLRRSTCRPNQLDQACFRYYPSS